MNVRHAIELHVVLQMPVSIFSIHQTLKLNIIAILINVNLKKHIIIETCCQYSGVYRNISAEIYNTLIFCANGYLKASLFFVC